MLKGSSEDEDETAGGPIFTTYDHAFAVGGSPLLLSISSIHLPSIHPFPIQIFQLWQIFLDNVHPLVRFLHAPTIQQKLVKSVNDLSSIPPPMHALLFAIYSVAVVSMRDTTCLDILADDENILTYRYVTATRCALQKSGFLRLSDTTVLQAVVLCLVCDFPDAWSCSPS